MRQVAVVNQLVGYILPDRLNPVHKIAHRLFPNDELDCGLVLIKHLIDPDAQAVFFRKLPLQLVHSGRCGMFEEF